MDPHFKGVLREWFHCTCYMIMHATSTYIHTHTHTHTSTHTHTHTHTHTQGNDVKVSEAALTGEAELVRKNETSSPMLFSGTQVRT